MQPEVIACSCGCGTLIEPLSSKGKPRRFVSGHNRWVDWPLTEAQAEGRCTKCGEVKPPNEFRERKTSRTGRSSHCKDCDRKKLQAWRSSNPDKRAAQNKRARPSEEKRRAAYEKNKLRLVANHREWLKTWKAGHPEEWRLIQDAYMIVKREVRNHRLIRGTQCEECGKQCRTEAAHFDYTRPLDVRWLCRKCHVRWDISQPKWITASPK